MATHSSILAWRIPWTEEPGRLQAVGSHRVGHDRSGLVCTKLAGERCELLGEEALALGKVPQACSLLHCESTNNVSK